MLHERSFLQMRLETKEEEEEQEEQEEDEAEATPKSKAKAKAKADTAAAYRSLQTVGSLLLTNADFRLFLSDLTVVGRQVFQDTAFALSGVAEDAGRKLAPSEEAVKALEEPGADDQDGQRPSSDDLGKEVAEASQVVVNGSSKVLEQTKQSVSEKLSGSEKETLVFRLKQAVLRLRQRPDYSDSVSTLSLLLKRWAQTYSRALQDTADVLQDDVQENAEADRALRNFYALVSSFGEKTEWEELESRTKQVLSHKENDPEFEELTADLGNSLQKLLTDPDFLAHADEEFQRLRAKSKKVGGDSPLRDDVDALLAQVQKTFKSVLDDKDVSNLIRTSSFLVDILSPSGDYVNTDLLHDTINVFGPQLISLIQTVPIPRLEISTPEIDLLLENLILTPGHTVNHSSFLPYKLGVTTVNDLVVRKARTRVASNLSTLVTLKLDGLSLRADDLGYWMRLHSGFLRFLDTGIASLALDERGIDIHITAEVAKERLEQILTLQSVQVHIHKLNFKLRSSKFSICAWLFRPLLRPILRKVLEKQIASGIADACRAANRELLFARERLRATRIADPKDLMTFFRAIAARLTPEEDPDLYTRVGLDQPGQGVFKGVYAPGSLVKTWVEEGRRAEERVEDGAEVVGKGNEGWRNEVFDVHVGMLT